MWTEYVKLVTSMTMRLMDSKTPDASVHSCNLSTLWLDLRNHEKMLHHSSQNSTETHGYEMKRTKFCEVAADPQSSAVKWIMKNLKRRGDTVTMAVLGLAKVCTRKTSASTGESHMCSIAKALGLWKCVQEKALPLPDEMKTLLNICSVHLPI